MESPETNPHIYGQLIFYKHAKNIEWRKKSLFKNGRKPGYPQGNDVKSLLYIIYKI